MNLRARIEWNKGVWLNRMIGLLPLFDVISGKVYFKDRTLYDGELHVKFEDGDRDWALIRPQEYEDAIHKGFVCKYKFAMNYFLDDMEGNIVVRNGYTISDNTCMKLFHYNIDIDTLVPPNEFDKTAITRRHTINNIIK